MPLCDKQHNDSDVETIRGGLEVFDARASVASSSQESWQALLIGW